MQRPDAYNLRSLLAGTRRSRAIAHLRGRISGALDIGERDSEATACSVQLYQGALIMTHRDRAGDPPGRREAAGDAGPRQGFPTPSGGSPARPERRLPKAFGRRIAFRWGAWLPMSPHRYATRSWPKALGNRLYGSLSALLGIKVIARLFQLFPALRFATCSGPRKRRASNRGSCHGNRLHASPLRFRPRL